MVSVLWYLFCGICFVLSVLWYLFCGICFVLSVLCFLFCAICFVLSVLCYLFCAISFVLSVLCYLFCAICFVLSVSGCVSSPDALSFLQVFGHKDTDGFYRAAIRERVGLIPCNMVSEIQTEDYDMMDQLLKQGFLPLNTPVEKLGETSFSLLYPLPSASLVSLTFYPLRLSLATLSSAKLSFTDTMSPFLYFSHLITFVCFPVKWTATVSKMAAQ